MNVLAIIPARGGSKGIPMKNIQKLMGKPLISHTIKSARNSTLINKIIVSTDNKDIAKIARKNGAEVPFLRPKKISHHGSSVSETVKHTTGVLLQKQGYVPDIIVVLQPTSPLRSSKLIDKAIHLLIQSKATSVLSVSKVKTHPYSSFWMHNKYLKPFKTNFTKFYQRQKYPKLYFPTGDIYAFWNKTLTKYDSMYGPKIKPLLIEDIHVDVDDLFDLFVCEMKLRYWERYKSTFNKIR